MNKKVVILGAGGHAHVIADIVRASGDEVVAFLDDNLSQPDCAGPISNYINYLDCLFVIGIGDNNIRESISKLEVKWYTAIHPSAIISPSATIGEGTVVMPNSVVNARSVIGKHCIINTSSVVEHDNVIGNYTHISVGAKLGGTVHVGKKVFIAIGSSVRNNVSICDEVICGMGSVITKSIIEPGVYYGNPASRKG